MNPITNVRVFQLLKVNRGVLGGVGMRIRETLSRKNKQFAPRRPSGIATTISLAVTLLCWIASPPIAGAITAADANQIELGFQVFNTQTFGGNGRTCSTCHLPQSDFTISPADLRTLSAHQLQLVFGTNIHGGNAGGVSLENPNIVRNLLLFNINEGEGGTASEVGTVVNPVGPFRSSMSIGGLAFTTSNLLPDFCSSNSPPSLYASGLLSLCPAGVANFPASASPILLVNVFLGTEPPTFGNDPGPGVDEGTRNIELGWAGDGAITDPDVFGTTTTAYNADCIDAVNEALADSTDLTKTLRAFSLEAIKTHFTRTLNRVPGVDFQCPTPEQLDEIAAFQEYLGRQFELALKAGVPDDTDDGQNALNNFAAGTQVDSSQPVITFNDPIAEKGKAIFLDGHAQCNLCHFNAGANDIIGEIDAPSANDPSAPFPGRNFTSHQLTDLLRCTDKTGQPTTCLNGITATAHGLNALLTPVVLPQDPGDKVQAGGVSSSGGTDCGDGINSGGNIGCVAGKGLRTGGFNVQSIIEAPRKKSFFHNGAFTTTVEDAATFYFSPAADRLAAFIPPRNTGAGSGAQALAALASTYFSDSSDSTDVFNTLGFFLRSLSAVYSLADCERLANDSIDLIEQGQPTTLQTMLCTNDLQDVSNVMSGVKVPPPPQYLNLRAEVPGLQIELESAEARRSTRQLKSLVNQLIESRHSIATITPDLR
jgi:cytochrome c peroxidase